MLPMRITKRCLSLAGNAARDALEERIAAQLSEIKRAGLWKRERSISTPQSSTIRAFNDSNRSNLKQETVLNFCSNNYLGLANDPVVVDAAKKALDDYGAGMASVRFICGTLDIHRELEEKLANFYGMPSAILYGSCFDANAGLFEALLGPDDLVLSDALNHASIIDGIRLCKAEKVRYAHGNMAELKDLLERASKTKGIKLIATDGVFSMDGDVARLDEICELAQRYGALVFVDDCHGTGVLGASGRGTSEHFGNLPIDIINSTLGKALGGASGGYTVASKSIVDLLRQRSRPYLFSNTLAPALVASASAAIDCVGPELLEKLRTNIQLFRQRMTEARLRVAGDPAHPIAPVMVGEAKAAATIASQMWNEGIYVVGFSYPVVPKGAARIRTQISAIHTADQIELAVEAFAKVAREHKLLQ